MTHIFEGEFVHQNLGRIRKEFRVDQMCEWETRKATVRGLFFHHSQRMIFICRIVKKGTPFGRLHMVKDRYL